MPEIKNLKKIAEKLLEAIQEKERILLYGDADLDGVASVVIVREAIENLGGKIEKVYFPDREKEGYGITKEAIKALAKFSPALFLALDCGIGNVKEIDLIQKKGFEVIILDHHKMLPEVPKASIICNPRQESDPYPFKELATAGITYKLAKCLFSIAAREFRAEKFLELAALATLADLMPLKGDNEKIVREGILALKFTKREGLRALIELKKLEIFNILEVRRKIVSPLNAASPIDHLSEAYLLFTEKDPKKAKERAKELIEKARLRRKDILQITEDVINRMEPDEIIVFEGDESWPLVLLGPVASRICQKYKKPVFLYKKRKDESPGAVRTPKGVDSVKAMESCRELLITYGGHPQASGFRIKTKNLEKFKEWLIHYFKNRKSK